MVKHIRRLVLALCIIPIVILPAYAVELIITDRGRNTAWSENLRMGDDFSTQGADTRPIGGVMPNTSAINQILVPMPNDRVLMPIPSNLVRGDNTENRRTIWVNELEKLLKDRAHIAITNNAAIFEIQLLQNTPKPSNSSMSWKTHPHTERFAQMVYQAIGHLVDHLQTRKEPVRITAALADSGSTAFALGIDEWKPYAGSYRRVDLVDGHASLTQIRPVISTLGSKRVRLFRTTGIPKTPSMTIGRKEVAENLLKSHPYLVEYVLTSSKSETSASRQYAKTSWISSLSGSDTVTVRQRQYVEGKVNEWALTNEFAGLDFRDPIAGLDPENLSMQATGSLIQLGIVEPVSPQIEIHSLKDTFNTNNSKLSGVSNSDEILVIDFIGLNDKIKGNKLDHAVKFKDTVLPRSNVITVGFDGLVDKFSPNGIRKDVMTYSAIVPASKTSHYERSARIVHGLINQNQTIIEFDFNEILIPQQLRIFTNKIRHPAMVAANVAERWLNENPNGKLILRGHSDGTYAVYDIVKHLNEINLSAHAVILESPRQATKKWINLAKKNPETIFMPITARNDLLRENQMGQLIGLFDPGYKKIPNNSKGKLKNWLSIDIQNFNIPLKAHSAVTNYRDFFNLKVTNSKSSNLLKGIPLGKFVKYKLFPSKAIQDKPLYRKLRSYISWTDWQSMGSKNQNTLKLSNNTFGKHHVSRLTGNNNSQTIFAKGPLNLDKAYNERSLIVKRDPIGYKTPRQNDLVIEPLSYHEDSYTLGPITRNTSPPPNSMKAGYIDYQKHMDDLPDLNYLRTSNTSISFTNNFSMSSGFNSGMNSINNKQLPLPLSRQDIGGVMLNTSANVEGGKNTLSTHNISLVFQNSAGVIDFMKLQRFSTALWATYLSVKGPGISIDPIEKDPEHGNKHKVRHIGQVRNTELGKVMRETDYLMKRWAIGTHRPDIDKFLSPDDFNKNLAGKIVSNRPSRFWFIPKGFTFKRSNNMLLFSSGNMTLETEYLENNLKDEKNPANELFAQWFTKNYDLVAQRYSIFNKLFEYAQLVSLSTYLRENRIPMLWFLMANRELILTENAIDKVDELVKKSGYKWRVKMYGGVELDLSKTLRDEKIYKSNSTLQNVEDNLTTEQRDNNTPVVFSENDTSYTVSSKNILKLINSSAEGDIVQTDLALADQYHEKVPDRDGADNEWNLIAPRLELVRYYNPELQTRAQFGDGWHLLVPFRLETKQKRSLSSGDNPKQVVLVNLLSGIREVVFLEKCVDAKLKYRGEERDGLTKCLERRANGSWVLEDILGGKFTFDQDGDLTELTLRENKQVKYKLISKKYTKNIPGYTAKYRYDIRMINGKDQKILTSIKQSNHTARIDWHPDDTKQIVGIRVLKQGRPVEVLKYAYGNKKMLKKISAQSGQNISVRYQDNNQRVSVSQ